LVARGDVIEGRLHRPITQEITGALEADVQGWLAGTVAVRSAGVLAVCGRKRRGRKHAAHPHGDTDCPHRFSFM